MTGLAAARASNIIDVGDVIGAATNEMENMTVRAAQNHKDKMRCPPRGDSVPARSFATRLTWGQGWQIGVW
jgi:hypothetical protein